MCWQEALSFGNDSNTLCCGLTSIILRAQIVKGKDRLSQQGTKQDQELRKTVGHMLRMLKPIFGLLKAIVFDRGFCLAKGIVGLEDRGMYGGALIKKRQYW